MPSLSALWKFARPHTIYGTSISLLGVFLVASAGLEAIPLQNWVGLLVAELACLFANIYIVGLNQITDVEIDRINKPYLPLVSGELSRPSAIILVSILAVLALVISGAQNIYLFGTVLISMLIGTAYSLPPFRLKRFPLFASLCIFTVRGLVVNLGIFWYFRDLAGQPPLINPAIACLCLFVTVFTLVIAIFKDIPDIAGDRKYDIVTFSVQLGKKTIFNVSCWLLVLDYLLIPALAILWADANLPLLATSHLAILGLFAYRRARVNLDSDSEIYDFYQFIWQLFYIEYLILPLAWIL